MHTYRYVFRSYISYTELITGGMMQLWFLWGSRGGWGQQGFATRSGRWGQTLVGGDAAGGSARLPAIPPWWVVGGPQRPCIHFPPPPPPRCCPALQRVEGGRRGAGLAPRWGEAAGGAAVALAQHSSTGRRRTGTG